MCCQEKWKTIQTICNRDISLTDILQRCVLATSLYLYVSVLAHYTVGMILWIVLNYQCHTTTSVDKYGTEVIVKVDMYMTQILASN